MQCHPNTLCLEPSQETSVSAWGVLKVGSTYLASPLLWLLPNAGSSVMSFMDLLPPLKLKGSGVVALEVSVAHVHSNGVNGSEIRQDGEPKISAQANFSKNLTPVQRVFADRILHTKAMHAQTMRDRCSCTGIMPHTSHRRPMMKTFLNNPAFLYNST